MDILKKIQRILKIIIYFGWYDELKDDYYVRLQVFNKYLPRCGVDDLEDNTWSDPEYHKAYERYSEELEMEDESRNWRPGDAPWKAPGMSISDFI